MAIAQSEEGSLKRAAFLSQTGDSGGREDDERGVQTFAVGLLVVFSAIAAFGQGCDATTRSSSPAARAIQPGWDRRFRLHLLVRARQPLALRHAGYHLYGPDTHDGCAQSLHV